MGQPCLQDGLAEVRARPDILKTGMKHSEGLAVQGPELIAQQALVDERNTCFRMQATALELILNVVAARLPVVGYRESDFQANSSGLDTPPALFGGLPRRPLWVGW
jgi:hypothetical protein